ncbi:MAG TPA: ATP-dependent Clp protease ATP-binding protein ClpC, partial [Synergistaceae bacterium]|nr:ATP-dependent Clp protease ATP-binding protein ClpC [Synergistaceae bacterium]
DEIEKAHPDIFNIPLQILEDGRLTDGQGHTVDFRNSVVIMTSNIGAKDAMKGQGLGFAAPGQGEMPDWERVRAGIVDSVKKTFRPEFINRIDEMIVFEPLGREDLLKVLDLMLREVSERLSEKGIHIEIPVEARTLLLDKGYDPKYGARPLRRAVQRLIEDRLADLVLEGRVPDESRISVSVEDGELVLVPNAGSLEGRDDVREGLEAKEKADT